MTTDLRATLAALDVAARHAGIDPEAAADDARALSAAVAESNRGSYLAWCEAFGLTPSATPFYDAASRGRRYRGLPTPTATQAAALSGAAAVAYRQALVDVCTAAALLGEPGPTAMGAAQLAGAAQLGAAMPAPPAPGLPTDSAHQDFARQAPAILADVLARLGESQQRMLDLNRGDPLTPGAIPGLPGSALPTPNLGSAPAPSTPAPAPVTAAQPPEPDPAEATPEQPKKSVEEWLAELDELIGLASVKTEIHRQTAILRVDALRAKAGLKSPTITRHLVFTGNPGTGKTTVARMVAGIYAAIGLLSKGQLIEVDRSELVAGYLGQTAIKTAEVVASATGGVLFIDEAYSLNGDQYGEEAINTLVKEMEDKRDDLVVIVAGYTSPMIEFVANNPGLASRFRTTIEFSDYTDDELEKIFTQLATRADYDLDEACADEFRRQLSRQLRDHTFGNGRWARNLFEAAIGRHAWRLREVEEPTLEQLRTLAAEDLIPDPAPAIDWEPVGDDEPQEQQE
ncbi:MAG: AAA family ATPase [Actinobacteria bacterium]|nr:AAA family ATPase [Actinomycetota bacterium]